MSIKPLENRFRQSVKINYFNSIHTLSVGASSNYETVYFAFTMADSNNEKKYEKRKKALRLLKSIFQEFCLFPPSASLARCISTKWKPMINRFYFRLIELFVTLRPAFRPAVASEGKSNPRKLYTTFFSYHPLEPARCHRMPWRTTGRRALSTRETPCQTRFAMQS